MKHLNLTPGLYDYLLDVSLHEHPVLQALRQETEQMPLACMQVAPEQAQFMQLLLRVIRAKNVLELGTFTGYSALAMALALPKDGQVITCDISTEWTQKTSHFWRQAKQDKKIELRLGPALETLDTLLKKGLSKSFDFIFIDADKSNIVTYYELALQLVTSQGLIAIDNALWSAKVIDEQVNDAQTREIRKLNALLRQDKRVYTSLLPIADGLFLVQPRDTQGV